MTHPVAERCWLASLPGAGACDGRLVRVHLIPKQLLKKGPYVDRRGRTRRIARDSREAADIYVDGGPMVVILDRVLADPRSWVWACGGIMGNAGHHGMLDSSRTLRIPRHRLPPEVEEFAEELGLGWWLDREYGIREVVT